MQLADKIKNQPPELDLLGEGKHQLKALLTRIFEKDPERRITIYDLLDDPWVTSDGQNLVDLDCASATVSNVNSVGTDFSENELK